ncbi:MAG: hypothetical protein KC493_09820 [Bacteriovoracaceae bacterium]|nr:hypothetical protein [Bacteriovoracaceae bacterium]
MIHSFQQEIEGLKDWQILKKEILSETFPGYQKFLKELNYYSLVSVLVDSDGTPKKLKENSADTESYMVFTDALLINRISRPHNSNEILNSQFESLSNPDLKLTTFMLGDLIKVLRSKSKAQSIKVNPILFEADQFDGNIYLCEEVLFAPLFDQVTKKYMMTSPDQALALLAINPNDQERFGIEIIFHAITNSDLPDDKETREEILKTKIDELGFYAPRIPIKRGSASIYCVLLNLENAMEETAFIRSYKTFDRHTDIIFVTSDLEIRTGNLDRIPYHGEKIDTIFTPIIQWQQNQVR